MPDERKTLDQWLYEPQAPGRALTAEEIGLLRDALALRRMTGREWAALTAIKPRGEGPTAPPPDSGPVTQDEAILTMLVGMNDLLHGMVGALLDVQARLTRAELFLATILPGYDQTTRRVAGALTNGQQER